MGSSSTKPPQKKDNDKPSAPPLQSQQYLPQKINPYQPPSINANPPRMNTNSYIGPQIPYTTTQPANTYSTSLKNSNLYQRVFGNSDNKLPNQSQNSSVNTNTKKILNNDSIPLYNPVPKVNSIYPKDPLLDLPLSKAKVQDPKPLNQANNQVKVVVPQISPNIDSKTRQNLDQSLRYIKYESEYRKPIIRQQENETVTEQKNKRQNNLKEYESNSNYRKDYNHRKDYQKRQQQQTNNPKYQNYLKNPQSKTQHQKNESHLNQSNYRNNNYNDNNSKINKNDQKNNRNYNYHNTRGNANQKNFTHHGKRYNNQQDLRNRQNKTQNEGQRFNNKQYNNRRPDRRQKDRKTGDNRNNQNRKHERQRRHGRDNYRQSSQQSQRQLPRQPKGEMSRETEQPQKQVVEVEYKNNSKKYLRNCQKINQKCEQIDVQIRRLKQYFFLTKLVQSYKFLPTELSLLKSLDYPMFVLQYTYEESKRYMNISQLQQSINEKIEDFYQIVRKLYDLHYFKVDIIFEESLLQLAKIKANEDNIRLALSSKKSFTQKTSIKKLFYYSISKDQKIQVAFFDFKMKLIQFGEGFIFANRSKVYKEVFEQYELFSKSIKVKEDDIIGFGEEQLDSDHQEDKKRRKKPRQQRQIKIVYKRLYALIDTDFKKYQEQMQDKNNQLNQLLENQSTQYELMDKLADEVDVLKRNLDNFNQICDQIEDIIEQTDFDTWSLQQELDFIQLSCKRIILAKKQIESDLPILGKKRKIFELLDKSNLLIIEGETGSGKSTQLPQLLCEYYRLFSDPQVKPVLITQPRKIATRSLAQRVADELEEKCGDFVDYVASSDKTANPKAKIVFKLDRLVLDELVESPTLDEYSCLVIDEAHERTISIDVILGLVKELLQKRKNFKVIITSASMEISLFEKYFNTKTLKVSGRMFPVNVQYLPSKEEDTVKKIEKAIDNELLTERNMLKDKYKGHILVFCADTKEIETLTEIFQRKLNHNVFMVIPLHGKLSTQEQKKAFLKTKEHKLIFASRIAETAITIDGVKVVIDPGWDREMQYDQKTKFSSMKLVEISQSSAKQRAGRAGRTQEGYCLRLYSKFQYQNRRQNKLPQIKNIPLQSLVLRLKVLSIENVSIFDYIQKPDHEGLQASIQVLKMIGCLNQKQSITSIGRLLVRIPIEPFLARSIIQALLMEKTVASKNYPQLDRNCTKFTSSVIHILCMAISAGNLFRISQNYRELGERIKYEHFYTKQGDFFFLKQIYRQYLQEYQKRNHNALNNWLRDHFLSHKTLIQVKDLVKEIQSIIKNFRIDEKQMKTDIMKCRVKLETYTSEEDRILSCLTTSFVANLCLYTGNPQIGYTYMNLQKVLNIYGTSCLSLLGQCPKWILAYDFYQNVETGKLYCKVANGVSYDFLKNTVDNYVFRKYQIDKAQKVNPYFKLVTVQLETYLRIQLKEVYIARNYANDRRNCKQTEFLKNLDLGFSEEQNQITAFIRCQEKFQNAKTSLQIQLQRYIDGLRKQASNSFSHNYIGNIFTEITDGFVVKRISFKKEFQVYDIFDAEEETIETIKTSWSPYVTVDAFGKDRLKMYFYSEDDSYIEHFKNYLQQLIESGARLKYRVSTQDKRNKLNKSKISLHWYAGKCQKDNVLINYNQTGQSIQDLYQKTLKACEYINQAIDSLRRLQNIPYNQRKDVLMRQSGQIGRVGLTKKGDGINLFKCELDQIELHRFFSNLIVSGVANPFFQMPKFIKKFRDYERPYCEWSNEQWTQKINQLLKNLSKKENFIEVRGFRLRPKPGQKLSNLQQSYRIDMVAEIQTFENNLFTKLKNKYDGQRKVLGCEKMHVTGVFKHPIQAVDSKVFQSLKNQYTTWSERLREEFPGLVIDSVVRQTRRNDKKSKVFIYISSENREYLSRPVSVISGLFTPRFINLQDSQFRFLNQRQGDRILEEIQTQYKYKIYFGFEKQASRVKLYCPEALEGQIKKKLKAKLSSIKHLYESISYKGRNLKIVEEILKIKQEQIETYNRQSKAKDKKYLDYEIKFTRRQVGITADIQTLNEVKMKIMNVKINESTHNCQICNQLMMNPYRLLNCQHSFCWFCLSLSIKEFKFSQSDQLTCCYFDQKTDAQCKKLINIYDIAKILSQQQLMQIFDLKISKYVDAHPEKYAHCFSPNCEQIFQRQVFDNEKEIDCQFCGKIYCLKCKESHPNYSCEDWKNRQTNKHLSSSALSYMGIKKCPNCSNGIQKNQGCNHISCKCGAHLCWTCMKCFKTSGECYDHMGSCGAGY